MLLILAVFFAFFSAGASATYITLQADGAPFTTNETITFYGTMDSNNVDLNVVVRNSAGTVTDENYLSDRNGFYSIAHSYATAGDYNIVVRDLNNGVQSSMPFRVSNIASVSINYDNLSLKPPFDASSLAVVPVTFTAYNAAGNAIAGEDLNVRIVNSSGVQQDFNSGTTNADGNAQLRFNLSGYSAGTYYFSVNNGLASFSFSIYSFRMYLSLANPDTNNAQSVFKPGTNGRITVDVMNYAGTQYISTATVAGAVYNSSNVAQSALSFSSSGGSYYALFTAPATIGDYYLDINVTYGGTTQSQKISFKVQNYSMEVVSSKFEGGGMGEKEKMPSVFPTASNATLQLYFSEINASELSGTSLDYICNNGSAQDHNFLLYYKKMGAMDWNSVLGEGDIHVADSDTYCSLSFRTPANASTYFIKVVGKDLNVEGNTLTLSAKTMVTVQDYLVFLEPVDPSSCDTSAAGNVADSCGFKFQFTVGEKIGLRPDIIDMKSGTSVNQLSSVHSAVVFKGGSETTLSSPTDVNFRADLNILAINASSTVQNLSGGFYPGGFVVDVNSNGVLAQQNVTAFGFFYLRVLNVTTELVDVNGNSIASHGPPTYSSDKNTYIKLTVKDSDGSTAIRGAVVTVSRIMNFEEREVIDVSGVDSNATNSSGIVTIALDYQALGMGSGEFEIELDINAATLGKTDTVMTHFERRNFFLKATPINKNNCGPLPMIAGDMNSTFLLEAKNAWNWQVINDLNVTDVKVFYEGSPSKPLSMPVEKTVASFKTGTMQCGGEDYNYVDVNHNGTWEQGFYKFVIYANSALKGNETVKAFIMVQPFFIVAVPAVEGDLGMLAEPGAQWDFNIMSAVDVNLSAKLMDMESWSLFASDLNMHLKETGDWISGTGSNYAYDDVNAGTSAYTTIDVNLPANLSIAKEMDIDGYILQIDANYGTTVATIELFIVPLKWQVVVSKQPEGMWASGDTGPFFFWITGDDHRKMYVDDNVIDNCLAIADERGYTAADISDAGLNYSRIVMVKAGDDDENGTQTDWNAIILIDTDNERVYVDRDNDCNFNEEPDINALTVGSHVSGMVSNMMYEDWDDVNMETGQAPWRKNPWNGVPIITGITKGRLWYTTDTMAQYANYANFGLQGDAYIGTYDTDQNFGIPLAVKTLRGTPVNDVQVSIYSVMLAEMGGGMPTQLTEGTDYNKFGDMPDSNGIALPKIAVNDSGIIMTGFKITDGATTQFVMPWQGAVFQTKSYSVVTSYGLEDLNIVFDQNAVELGLDVNTDVIPLTCFNPNTTLIGVLREEDVNTRRSANVRLNLDNDTDENRAPIVDENWYFIPLTGHASCPMADFGTGRAKLLIDDDTYIDVNMDDGMTEYNHKGGMELVGAPQNLTHRDLNEVTVSSASAFLVCLYGEGKCSSDGHGYNPGSLYDLNDLADDNIQDGIIMYNLFDYSDQFYNPETYGSSPEIREYLRLEVRDLDYNYVTTPVSASGSVFSESTGLQVIPSFSGSVPDGRGRRILMDGNFAPTGTNGSGFMVSVDVNYNNDVTPTYGFLWSRAG